MRFLLGDDQKILSSVLNIIGVSKTQLLDSFKAKINYYFFPWRTKEVILQKGSMWLAIGLVGKHGGGGGGERIWHENEFKIIEDLFPCKPVEKILFQVKQAQ